MYVGHVEHNGTLLGTELSHITLTPANSPLIPSVLQLLGGTLFRDLTKLYWVTHFEILFCPIAV